MDWLYANLFLLAIVLIGAGLMFLVGFTMWHLGLPPDKHPVIAFAGGGLAIYGTVRIGGKLLRFIQKRL